MKLQDIQDLIKMVSRLGVTEVEIEQKDFKLTIKSEGKRKKGVEHETTVIQTPIPMGIPQVQMPVVAAQPVSAPVPVPQAASASAEDSDKYITVKSPMIGTFYRASGPDKDAFINVGDAIKPGRVICIVEAMKLFNEIESEVSGSIVKVLVDDASPVEYDQPLFLVDPS
ncbi:MAG: acetyl-CoA carboxylase biotin carboxyl carrier protein [Bacteroidetes bacterium]|nr:MAG: acetyl-CoA carboxylase biotin carboxyl carrier protein [Bacteroidota bacterium]